MDDRRHVHHDPSALPPEIIDEGGLGRRPPPVSPRARGTLWVLLWVVLGVIVLCVVASAAAFMYDVWFIPPEEPFILVLSEDEEAGVRGLATSVADRGRRGDYGAIVALGDQSKALDPEELAADVESAFGGAPIKDWSIDAEGVQVLVDAETDERIVVFRLDLTGEDGSEWRTNPLYAIEREGTWYLTGIKGRDVEEVLYYED